jgi:hypothetical protein
VDLAFDWACDTEAGFDYVYCILEVEGTETLLQAFDGIDAGSAAFDLAGDLGPAATDYRVKFRFVSDTGWSDEDGSYDAVCAPFVIDGISLVGGGESYACDFEDHVGGWYQPEADFDNPVSEMWLVENRQKLGSDAYLHAEGLMLYHLDQEVAHSALGNTGGASDEAVRGVVVEEADGLFDLLDGDNRGDAGDAWPGSTLKTAFDGASTPSSTSNDGTPTQVAVTGITAVGDDMEATLVGGDPAPVVGGVEPAAAEAEDGEVVLDLSGEAHLRHGATVRLVKEGAPDVDCAVSWIDADTVGVVCDLSGVEGGTYDLVVENPDGQTAVLEGGFLVLTAVATPPVTGPARSFLAQNYPNPFNPRTTIRYQLDRPGPVRIRVVDVRGRLVRLLVDRPQDAGWYQVTWDGTDQAGQAVAGGLYLYQMEAGDFSQQRKLLLVK